MSAEQQPLIAPQNADEDLETNTPARHSYCKWRRRTAEFLESPTLHYLVIALVVIDSACVLADLGYTVLSDTCTPVEGPDAPVWLDVLSHVSLIITTLFLGEIPVTLWAFGPTFYNPVGPVTHASLHLFDALIIVTTFVLEVVLRGRERELASLLIILRLWRLVKLVGGIAVGAGELEEETVKQLAQTREQLEKAVKALTQARDENQQLRARLTRLETEGLASAS